MCIYYVNLYCVILVSSEDNQILLWDIRRASGPVTTFDQYNGANMGSSSNGECSILIPVPTPSHTRICYDQLLDTWWLEVEGWMEMRMSQILAGLHNYIYDTVFHLTKQITYI